MESVESVPAANERSVRGALGLGTLPRLIRTLHENRSTGTLRINARGIEQRVHFKWGAVVFASSDRREHRLDKRLRREDLVDKATLKRARALQESSGGRFGECLIELGAISEAELLAAVERQVRAIVTFLFSLDRGEYHFEETEEPIEQDLALDLPMREIIIDGIRSMEDPIALQIGVGAMTDYLHAGLASETANVTASEGFVLSRVDGRTNVLDILAVSPMGDVETLISICALLAVGIVETKNEPAPEPAHVAEPVPETKRQNVEPPPPPTPVLESPVSQSVRPEPEPSSAVPEPAHEVSDDVKRRVASERYQEGRRLFNDGKFHEAIGALMEAVRLDGREASYHQLLGRAYARNPKWRSSAIEHLVEASRLDEYDETTHYALGEVYESEGREEEARASYKRVVALEPNHERARQKLRAPGVVSRLISVFKKTSHR